MGKTQSKRSVDITTEAKKGPEEEVTGKLEKIEDIDQKQVNGDTTTQENKDAEKKDSDESENDKDLTTEKNADLAQASGDTGDQNTTTTAATATVSATSSETQKDNSVAVDNKEGNVAVVTEEISPLADESNKKSKKEKVKKKWSFRSISFGKKDKQKPAKTDETTENVAASTNGEPEKLTDEGEVIEKSKNDESAAGDAEEAVAKPTEQLENGDATEKELNGQKTPTEDKPTDVVANETINTATTAILTTTTNETAIENQTENKAATNSDETIEEAVTTTANATTAAAEVVSNGGTNADKNIIIDDIKETTTDKADSEDNVEQIKTIPSVLNDGCDAGKPHQNGISADEPEAEKEQFKSQTEVKIITDKTPAENLAFSYSASSNPMITINTNSNAITVIATHCDDLLSNSNKAQETEVVVAGVNFGDSKNDDICTTTSSIVNKTAAVRASNEPLKDEEVLVSIQGDSQPPPLPISPPPSQVSVFAFNENTETTANEVPPTVVPSTTPSVEMHMNASEPKTNVITKEEELITISTSNSSLTTVESVPTVIDHIVNSAKESINEIKIEFDINIETSNVEMASTEAIDPQCSLPPQPSVLVNENFARTFDEPLSDETKIQMKINEDINVVAAVVNEITNKAIEIIQTQEQEKLQNQSTHEVPEEEEVETEEAANTNTNIYETDNEYQIENGNNTSNEETLPPPPPPPEAIDEIEISKELVTVAPLKVEYDVIVTQVASPNEDCSLISNLTQELTQVDDNIETLSSDFTSSTKEITNAKDLKETATAEITTQQDLPVTCE